MTKLSHAITNFEEIWNRKGERQLVVFLDYDGTLSPIVARPELAVMSLPARRVVSQLSSKFITAIVSGRAKANVKELVQLDSLFYAGSHGFDIEGPNNTLHHQVAKEYIPVLEQAYYEIQQLVSSIEGTIVENNIFSLSVHYRLVNDEENVKRVHDIVLQVLQSNETYSQMLRITHGKMVIELRANYDWHKGKAVIHLLEYMKLFDSEKVFAIYVGDDKTDEDAFKALREHSVGIGILVASGNQDPRLDTTARLTSADYYVPDCDQVVDFLQKISQHPLGDDVATDN